MLVTESTAWFSCSDSADIKADSGTEAYCAGTSCCAACRCYTQTHEWTFHTQTETPAAEAALRPVSIDRAFLHAPCPACFLSLRLAEDGGRWRCEAKTYSEHTPSPLFLPEHVAGCTAPPLSTSLRVVLVGAGEHCHGLVSCCPVRIGVSSYDPHLPEANRVMFAAGRGRKGKKPASLLGAIILRLTTFVWLLLFFWCGDSDLLVKWHVQPQDNSRCFT